jgi:hypothetical protein
VAASSLRDGDGEYRRNHPQAALEAATLPSYQIKFDRLLESLQTVNRRFEFSVHT